MHHVITTEENVIWVKVSDKLTHEDYVSLIASWEKLLTTHDKMRLGFEMEHFSGWEPVAAWDDMKFSLSHSDHIERVAMVGDKKWEEWLVKITSIFVKADVRYFDTTQMPAAQTWLRS